MLQSVQAESCCRNVACLRISPTRGFHVDNGCHWLDSVLAQFQEERTRVEDEDDSYTCSESESQNGEVEFFSMYKDTLGHSQDC